MSRPVRTLLAITRATLAAIMMAGAAGCTETAGLGATSGWPTLRSLYVPMPDGVRLAVDVWLPSRTTAGARLPTVLETDRYWRARAYAGGITNNPDYPIAAPWNERGVGAGNAPGVPGVTTYRGTYVHASSPAGRDLFWSRSSCGCARISASLGRLTYAGSWQSVLSPLAAAGSPECS
jgi:hypothetical protein